MNQMTSTDKAPNNGQVHAFCCVCGDVPCDVVRREQERTIVRCRSCTLIFRAKVTYADTEGLYEEQYWSGSGELGYAQYFEHPEVHEIWSQSKLDGVAQTGKRPPGRILDVGCAAGDFLMRAQQAGWESQGIEISNYASALAREKGLDVHTGTLLDSPYAEGSLDVITMWDVIEHLPDPALEARKLYSLLKPGGVLVISTPNVGSLRSLREQENWHGYRSSLEHFVFFTPRTLRQVLAKAGFGPMRSDTFMIDARARVLLNPWSDCRNLPVAIPGQRYYHIWEPNPATLLLSLLERWGYGHVLLFFAWKPE